MKTETENKVLVIKLGSWTLYAVLGVLFSVDKWTCHSKVLREWAAYRYFRQTNLTYCESLVIFGQGKVCS